MSKHIPHLDDVYPPALERDMLDQPYTLTVKDVDYRKFYSKFQKEEQNKYVLSFKKAKAVLICSPALAKRVSNVLGRDPTKWPGGRLTLFQDRASNGKECIGVREADPADNENTQQLDQAALDREYEEVFGE